jgi:RHS repeat-associated protein
VPFPFSSSRNDFMPALALSYNSGSGNGPFGLGWSADVPTIARKTERQLPEYDDEKDVFIFSGAEDLVPAYYSNANGEWIKDEIVTAAAIITRYKPRIEGNFARIEKITEVEGNVYWKVTTAANVVTIYGKQKLAQVADPADPSKIFKWLPEFSYDDKGNCFQFEYKQEDKTNVPNLLHEKNRLNDYSLSTNIYIKRIKYCNKQHFNRDTIDYQNWNNFLNSITYLLELVLDYGEHNTSHPQPNEDSGWPCRPDAFSDYRAGFEIRTRRLCRRVLMFHHFTELGTQPCLVRSLNFEYSTGATFTFLLSATQTGYIRRTDGSYSEKSLPPVEFTYEPLGWNTDIQSVPVESLENVPAGVDEQSWQWIDLYNEGIAGILTEQANGWYYKSNSGNGHFEAMQLVSPRPSLSGISSGVLHFQDVEGNGQKMLVSNELHGYYELTPEEQWLPFIHFMQVPNIDVHDPNVKFLDLNGDGRADLLVSEDHVFVWYASKGKEGYDSHRRLPKSYDEEKGPHMVFADSAQSIVLADMSGDGLMDIVRIRNAEIVYWPNLGYGKFGAKVSMDNAPVFDHPDRFHARYVKLADLDGSGLPGIVYLGKNTFQIYFNQSGNSWSTVNMIDGVNPLPFPAIDDHTNVQMVDLLGNGTACIVWSSPLPAHSRNPLRYIDLMGGRRPHVMTSYKNNMGSEVIMHYKSSTCFYLQDKKAGTPWITKLPFPVQCVHKVEMIDHIRKSRLTNHYTYHHGYYDHIEREFRGFGRVDQTDTEDFEQYKKLSLPNGQVQLIDEGFHQPPVLTKTWFHTGAFLDREKILSQFAHEYYHNTVFAEHALPEPSLPNDYSIDECREALRACKGMPLRVEVYSPDGSAQQQHPYTTAWHSCLVKRVQPTLNNQYAVFMVQQAEAISYTYERNPADPRIAHSMTIETDAFGNVLKAAAIAYGRQKVDTSLLVTEQAEQRKTHILFTHNYFTNGIDTVADYHLPAQFEANTYELTDTTSVTGTYFTIADLHMAYEMAMVIGYQEEPTEGLIQKRLIEQVRAVFTKNDMSGPLPLGIIESLALPWQTYKQALTPALVQDIFGNKVNDALLTNEGKYVHFDDDNYWIASGTQTFDAAHFYQVTEMTDPFGYTTHIVYDAVYRLFAQKTIDALQNTVEVIGFNFRTLLPYLIRDMNDNRSGVRIDELGRVVSSFVMGKAGEDKGDFMDDTVMEVSSADRPSAQMEYALLHYKNSGKPNFVRSMVREKHFFDSMDEPVIWQTSYAYSDGGGQVIMKKVQAEPGIALQENEDGTVTEIDTTPHLRWIGNGRTILNNKGNPVKQYEPYFSTTFEYEDAKQLVERGVTPVLHYDSAARNIRTDMPDGTFTKVVFDSWVQQMYDQNDTVLESQWYTDRILSPVPDIASPEEIAAANKTAAHANTPAVAYLDSLGRTFLTIADNGVNGKYKTIVETDIEGNVRKITDARGNAVMQYKYDILGNPLYQRSMDTGERWNIIDAIGKPIYSWDGRDHMMRAEYDQLHRPLNHFLQSGTEQEIKTKKIAYGEELANSKSVNLRGKPYQVFDAAGIITNITADFKGNIVEANRKLCAVYTQDINWNSPVDLEEELFVSTTVLDALNRPVQITAPDNSIITPVYNEANLLNRVEVQLKGAVTKTVFVQDIDYDAKGQRDRIVYGNNTVTKYTYDPKTFRLKELLTTGAQGTQLFQKLQYTFDPVGNISHITDTAQQTIFFNNTVVDPACDYVYDAVYQLISATGREHIGQHHPPSAHDEFRTNLPMPGDGAAMRNYTQQYVYDGVGNILQMIHSAGAGSWTRLMDYATNSNRLINHTINNVVEQFSYDEHGNILSLTHLSHLNWNYEDQLQQVDLGGGGHAYYVYDGDGQRIRKVIERNGGVKEERIYLSSFELYRKTNSAGIIQEQTETLHIMDDTRRIALVETKTIGEGDSDMEHLIRYQYSNHLGSSSLELDENAAILSYEEYHPYGTTSYQARNASIHAAAKRYRYTGMERDEESGLAYHSARYYLPWLGRWLSADPAGLVDGTNLYRMARNNPVRLTDITGHESSETDQVVPIVKELLDHYRIPKQTEIRFELLDDSGKVVTKGRFDVAFIDPRNKELVIPELKGANINKYHGNQKIYLDKLEKEGGRIRITSGKKLAHMGLRKGQEITLTTRNFFRFGVADLNDFGDALAQVTGGKPIKHIYNQRGKIHLFTSTEEWEKFLEVNKIKATPPKATLIKEAGKDTTLSRAAAHTKHAAKEVGVLGKAGIKGATTLALKGGKVVLKAVPVVGTLISIGMAAYYLSEGDYTNAALSLVEAIPIIGTPVAILREFVSAEDVKEAWKDPEVRRYVNDAVDSLTGMDEFNKGMANIGNPNAGMP